MAVQTDFLCALLFVRWLLTFALMYLTTPTKFYKWRHANLLKKFISVLPQPYSSLDSSRITVLLFSLSGLQLINEMNRISQEERTRIIDWIYKLQVTPKDGVPPDFYGFRGSFMSKTNSETGNEIINEYESANIAQTYSALCCLLLLGDDLKRVDRHAILTSVKMCQQEDGSFTAFSNKSENDMRFVFCGAAICYILNDFSYIDSDKTCQFIRKCFNYDGGFGQLPRLESHGGSSYCAVASLALFSHLWDESVLSRRDIEKLKRWALMKQEKGFHGRVNKPDDTCYAFWIGAILSMLNAENLVDKPLLRKFIFSTQDLRIGGFAKYEDSEPDILHTYFGIAALSIFNEPDVAAIHPALNLPMAAFEHLTRLNRRS